MKSSFQLYFTPAFFIKTILIVVLSSMRLLGQGSLGRIDIQPKDFSVYPGPTLSFTATGYDADDNIVPLINPTWEGTGGPLTPQGNTCDLVATVTGSHSISCSKDSITGTAIFLILGPLHHITITPDTAYLAPGDSVQLMATGYDEHDNPVALQNVTWSATGGTITSADAGVSPSGFTGMGKPMGYTVTYTAPQTPGTYDVTASDQGITSEPASMIVGGGTEPLDHIGISPSQVTLAPGEQRQFTATGYDDQNNPISGITFTWSATAGTIDQSGLLTAPASGNGKVYADANGKRGEASFDIAQQLDHIGISPSQVTLAPGEQRQFTATAYDAYNNPIPGATFGWTTTGNIGDVDDDGLFTAGTPGTGTVTASAGGKSGNATVQVTEAAEVSGDNVLLKDYSLSQNYPNPFNPQTIIHFNVKTTSHVSLKVVDITGREIVVLANSQFLPGKHKVVFNGTGYPSGVYFYIIRMNGFCDLKKMILLE